MTKNYQTSSHHRHRRDRRQLGRAVLFLAKGSGRVVATDISPNAKEALDDFVTAAWPALEQFGLAPNASLSNLRFTDNLEAAVMDWRSPFRRMGRSGSSSSRNFINASMDCWGATSSSHPVRRVSR